MKDIKILNAILILTLIGVSVFTQQKAAPGDELNWVRFESPAHDFSVSLPQKGYLVDIEDGAYRLHYVSGPVAIRVDMTPTSSAKDDFKLMYNVEQVKKNIFVKTGDFLISQFHGENGKKETEQLWLYLASSKGSCVITASTQDISNGAFRRFIDSIRLDNKPLYTPKSQYPAESQTILVSSLKSDAVILEALRKPDSKQKKPEKLENVNNEEEEKISFSRPLVILRKPKVQVNSARGRVISGTVRVRVTFLANGEVGNIVLLGSVDTGLTKSAFNAAKKIKFLPAEKDGKTVDVTKVLVYSFLIF